jgi:2-polyprenyl-3-methyl-5-hydroxy-6-metoxy-1,4-benzoquinol methylase
MLPAMRRETTNRLRYILEDVLPPVLRDSKAFLSLAKLAWGSHISNLAKFRADAPFLTEAEYEKLYRHHPRVHAHTDNSNACVERIIADVVGEKICDVGCGTGYLLNVIRLKRPDIKHFTGVDFVVEDAKDIKGIEYIAAKVENLPFPDQHFDTVICTHVIEHILDYRAAIAELRRITKQKLIIVVPREREYKYSFNPHFNFFPYTHSFLRAVQPVPEHHVCIDVGRDTYYSEMLTSDGNRAAATAA